MERWPTFFPAPNEDLSGASVSNAVRTQMESGAVRQRRRYSVDVLQLELSWTITMQQMLILASFHKDRINLGTDWFIMPLNLGGEMRDYEVRMVEGSYGQNYNPVNMWTVSAAFDVRERPVMSASYLALYLDLNWTEAQIGTIVSQSANLHTLVHYTLPSNLD